MIDDILEFNKKFVESKGYEKYITNKYPDKKIAILSCMDTRLTELLPAALGIRNGDFPSGRCTLHRCFLKQVRYGRRSGAH